METNKNLSIILEKFSDLKEKKQFKQLKLNLKELIKNNKNNPIVLNLSGIFYSDIGEEIIAEKCFNDAINFDPNFYAPYYNIGTIYYKKGDIYKAINFLNKAISLKNDYYDALINISNCYKILKKNDEAIKFLNSATTIQPNSYEAYNNLGSIYTSLKAFDVAENFLKKASELSDKNYGVENNIGLFFAAQHQPLRANKHFENSILLNPSYYDAYINSALSLETLKKYGDALDVIKKVISINKNFPRAFYIMSVLYEKLGKIEDAIFAAKKSLSLDKNFLQAYSQLTILYCMSFNHNLAKKTISEILNTDIDKIYLLNSYDISNLFFYSNYIENFSKKSFDKIISFQKKYYINEERVIIQNYNKKKIHIGFVSGDFKRHSVMVQMYGIFKELQKNSEVEIFAFSNTPEKDELTNILKKFFRKFIDIKLLSAASVSKEIRRNEVDVLVDLSGHTSENRIDVLRLKPARIQISWCGYLASIGLEEIDYIVADKYVIPESEKLNYCEKIIYLDSWSVLSFFEENIKETSVCPYEKNGYVTFGCTNHLFKINRNLISIWAKILKEVKNSKLLIKNHHFSKKELVNKTFEEFKIFGIDSNRLVLEKAEKRAEFMNVYNRIDLLFDTFPYGGGTTNLESAYMCVPIITKTGNNFLSRCGESVNNNLGLKELIARDDKEYVSKAIFFSRAEELKKIKKHLIKNKKNNILFSSEKIAKDFYFELKKIIKNVKA